MSIEAMKQALAALETCRIHSLSEWEVSDVTPKNVTAAISALRTAIQQVGAPQLAVGERLMGQVSLPDGSAFAIASFPLPKAHWLYAPREYATGAEEPLELPTPILTHDQREAVVAAIRYAVRGATMCGREQDFDPDAMVQNAVYALCGPYARVSAENTQASVNLALSQKPATGEPVACANPDGLKSNWHAHHVIVNKAALQMVRNALRNDVERGLKVRGEMLAELDLATFQAHPAPSVLDDVVRDAERYRFIRDADVSDDLIPDIALYAMESLDEYIDAAMLAAKKASARVTG